MNIKRCGTCRFAKLSPNMPDISKRVCWGAPPSAMQVMQGNRAAVQMVRPVVHVTDDACALHQIKEHADMVRDQEAMQLLQKHQTDTRQ